METIKQEFNPNELEQLKKALKRTYKERFEMATCLYKIHQTMNKANITHKPFIANSGSSIDMQIENNT